jgi:predicted nucleotidyltransferase
MKPDSEPVLAKSRPSVSVMYFRPGEILDFLRQKLSGRGVKAAWLFGSLSAGTAHSWSDIDM